MDFPPSDFHFFITFNSAQDREITLLYQFTHLLPLLWTLSLRRAMTLIFDSQRSE